jgi:hypothetical protein
MKVHRIKRSVAAALVLGVVVAACDEGTSPVEEFNPQEAVETMEAMTSTVESDELENAFGSLSAAGMLFGSTAALVADPLPAVPTAPTAAGAERLRALADGGTAADVLPPEYLGTTFEWNPEEMYYMPTEATGAPEDGVRVTYYAIDPTTGYPASPLNALGHVDLRDLSTASSDRLAVEIVRAAGNVTLADYYFDLAFTFTQSSLEVDVASVGYLSNGTDQLNFDVSQSLQATETQVGIDQSFSMDLEGTDNAVSFTALVTIDPESESDEPAAMDANVMVTNGAQTVELDVAWTGTVLDGTVFHNGDAVVLISGTLEDPQFTDPDGNPLTQQQINALEALWNSIGDMFEFVGGLFGFLLF